MRESNPAEEDHHARSNFVRSLVQHFREPNISHSALLGKPPRRIVQFWNDLGRLPRDVRECIETWRKLERHGFELLLFDELQAKDFIRQRLGSRYVKAYDACYHPAMQSDYFRLCYILIEGGCYIDTDDVYHGSEVEHLFSNGLLKIQPICYDTSSGEMVPPSIFAEPGANALSWIFYFNNNPLISVRGHPIVELALATATNSLLQSAKGKLPDIQSTTGPGNLTKTIFDAATANGDIRETLHVQRDWGKLQLVNGRSATGMTRGIGDSQIGELTTRRVGESLTSPAGIFEVSLSHLDEESQIASKAEVSDFWARETEGASEHRKNLCNQP